MTLFEVLITSGILVFMIAAFIGSYTTVKQLVDTSIAAHNLQRDVNFLMRRIIVADPLENGFTGLRSARSYTRNSATDLQYTDMNGAVRRYAQNGNTIRFTSPNLVNTQTIYTAPPNSVLAIAFTPIGTDGETLRITINITQAIGRLNARGNASTIVNLRNIPK